MQTKNARGEDTRRKLLEAATKLFSELGFHGASTRDIAGAARATLPSIEHHFGSKEGLYQAVLLELAAEMLGRPYEARGSVVRGDDTPPPPTSFI